jgi:3-hydroxyacyl-[acyl-carrier-protein] dehydratase
MLSNLSNLEVQRILPHRFPFLFVDKVIEVEPGNKVTGIKNVTTNEWFFQGHAPGAPILPGAIMVETLAQACNIVLLTVPEYKEMGVIFSGIDEFRFLRPVFPGDSLRLEAKLIQHKDNTFTFDVKAMLDDKVAGEGKLAFATPRKPRSNILSVMDRSFQKESPSNMKKEE